MPYLVSYLSRFMSLQPGDIITTGTPPGVGHGQKPPVYLRAGNEVRLGVEGLGEQTQTGGGSRQGLGSRFWLLSISHRAPVDLQP